MSPSCQPVPFRTTPEPGVPLVKPVPQRARATSLALPQRADKPIDCTACAVAHGRSRSHGEMRRGGRTVSFGSAVTPASGGSTTDGDEEDVAGGRGSFEWPWDEEEGRRRRLGPRRSMGVGRREDSSGSEADRWVGRYRAVGAGRSQSALGGETAVRVADGPRPWDMNELSGGGKNFASFGFRKGEPFGGENTGRWTVKGKGRDEPEGQRKRFRFLRRKLSVHTSRFRL